MEFGGRIILWRLLWVTVLVLVNGWRCNCYGYSREQERDSLLQLKASINHPNGTSLPSWVEGKHSFDYCHWEGIECNNSTGRLNQLSLNGTRVWALGDWYLNASVFLPFEELKSLYLLDNSLAGWFENEGSERLSSSLTNLEVLDLSVNNLNNSILSSLGGLSSLKFLYLSSNKLNGSIRLEELNDCISLKELDLSVNEIKSFDGGSERLSSSLTNMEVLDLSWNYLNNSILSSVGGFSSLKFLDLSLNKLNGLIRLEDLDALTNLEELDLSDNAVESFVTPKGVKSFSKLKVLHLDYGNYVNASILLQSLGAFSSLKTLYFRYNRFNGTINSQDLNDLSNLEELFLDGSSLNKNFLQSIGAMTSLKVISLSGCGLNGTLPAAQGWCELKRLQELDISDNGFDGPLPSCLRNLTSLQELDISDNGFDGPLPSCLGNLTSLRVLDLSSNQFMGNIASSPLTSLTLLEFVSFSNNSFEVPISFRSFANHSKLKVIFGDLNKLVVDSEFQTRVPTFQLKVFSLSECVNIELELDPTPSNFLFYQNNLRVIDLSHNNLRGKFPSWLLKNNTKLKGLYLRNNSFVGPLQLPSHPNPINFMIDISNNRVDGQIPTNIGLIFPNLVILNMSRNVFAGSIPSSFGDMKLLKYLDLSSNLLSGGIPEHLAMGCSSLWVLKVSNNNLHGQIFPKHVNLIHLNLLYLNGNNFMGEIPDNLSNIDLRALDISNNNLSGKLPRWMGNMPYLEEIDLSRNHLGGPIPLEFCKLDNLFFLDLSENNLIGSIPYCFNPSSITHVHLNKNKLRGPMTRAFYNSSSLVTLDLRDNNFNGNIPNWIGTLSALSILQLKGNQFEGKIPIQICHLKQLSMMDLSHNNLSGTIPPCLSNIKFEGTNKKAVYDGDMSIYGLSFFSYDNVWKTEFIENRELDDHLNPKMIMAYEVDEQVEFTTKRMSYSYKGRILEYMSGIDLSCNQLMGEIPPEVGNLSTIHMLNLSHNNLTESIPAAFSRLQQTESLDLSYNHLNGTIPHQLIDL